MSFGDQNQPGTEGGPTTATGGQDATPTDVPDAPTDSGTDAGTLGADQAGTAGTAGDTPPDEVAEVGTAPADDNRNKVIIGAIAVIVVIALFAFLLSRGGDKKDSTATNGTTDSAATVNVGNTVTIAGTSDNFERPDSPDSLGKLPNGVPWQVEAGTWGIQGGQAYVSTPAADRRNIAVVGLGRPEGQAQVRLAKVVKNAGLVFRYQGAFNFWTIEAVPEYATWNIIKVTDGKQKVIGNTGKSPIADGTVVGVRLLGNRIDVILNGVVAKSLSDKDLAGVGKVGMVAKGADAGAARFDDFTAGGPKGQGLVPPKGDATTTTK